MTNATKSILTGVPQSVVSQGNEETVRVLANVTNVTVLVVLTSFPLLYLECEVESSDGEVDSLRIHPPHLAQQVQNEAAFVPHQTRQKLWNPAAHRQYASAGGPLLYQELNNYHSPSEQDLNLPCLTYSEHW